MIDEIQNEIRLFKEKYVEDPKVIILWEVYVKTMCDYYKKHPRKGLNIGKDIILFGIKVIPTIKETFGVY